MIPKVLKNFNLFIDGRGYAGLVQELTLPKLGVKVDEFRAGGMDIPIELDMGMDKLECDFTLAEYNADTIKLFGLVSGAAVSLTLRGGLHDETPAITSVVVELKGSLKQLDMGGWKAGDRATLKASVSLRYYKLSINGVALVEVDAINMVRKINGVDQLADLRKAIGL